jgi:outer membrane protein TolC
MIKRPAITIITLFLAILSFAQPLRFSLDEAQEYATRNNYSVQSAEFDLKIADHQVKENISRGFPQLDGSVDYTYYVQLPTTIIPGDFVGEEGDVEVAFGKKHNAFLNLNLSQLIFDTRYFIGLRYSKTFKQLSREQLQKTMIDVKSLVAQTYYSILVNEEVLIILDSTKAVLEKTRYETGELFKEGFVEEIDYDQLTLTITDIDNSINDVNRQRDVSYDLMKFQMGLELEQEIELSESLEDILEKIEIEAALEQPFQISNNIDYRIVKSQEELSLLNVKNERSAYYPSINGFGAFQTSAQRDGFTMFRSGYPWFPTTSVGVSLFVPILSSGIRKARLDQARVQLDQVKINRLQLEQKLKLDLARARAAFRAAVENFFREEDNVELSRKIYDKTLIKYREGVTTSVELTQQHNQYFQSQSKYFETVLQLLNARIELDKTLGNYN